MIKETAEERLKQKVGEFPFCPNAGCEALLNYSDEGGEYSCDNCNPPSVLPKFEDWVKLSDALKELRKAREEERLKAKKKIEKLEDRLEDLHMEIRCLHEYD